MWTLSRPSSCRGAIAWVVWPALSPYPITCPRTDGVWHGGAHIGMWDYQLEPTVLSDGLQELSMLWNILQVPTALWILVGPQFCCMVCTDTTNEEGRGSRCLPDGSANLDRGYGVTESKRKKPWLGSQVAENLSHETKTLECLSHN